MAVMRFLFSLRLTSLLIPSRKPVVIWVSKLDSKFNWTMAGLLFTPPPVLARKGEGTLEIALMLKMT
jgi:hypothetical protein